MVGSSCGGGKGLPRGKPPFFRAAQGLERRRTLGSRASSSPCAQMAAWLREKNLVALEEGWWDPVDLQAQLREQQNLQAELDTRAHHQQRLQMVRPWAPGTSYRPEKELTPQSPGSWP